VPTICVKKADQKLMTSIRTYIDPGFLINRVVAKSGITADKLEEITLDDAAFNQYMIDWVAAHPKPPDPLLPSIRSFAQKMIALGFTKAELKAVFSYISKKLD
jgi:hypothetical protein